MAREIVSLAAPTFVPSSDAAERDEAAATSVDYWSNESEDDLRLQEAYASQPVASTSKLSEPETPSLTTRKRRRLSSSPPATHRQRSSSLPDAADALQNASPPARLSSPRAASPSPAREASVEPMQEDNLPAGRSLRARTAVQQNPFTAEHARYAGVLNRNGWEDAVLRLPKAREETEEERRERKRRQAIQGQDDLQGWLILEDGTRVRREGDSTRETGISHSDDDFNFEPRERIPINRPPKTARKQTEPRVRHYDDDYDRLRASTVSSPAHSERNTDESRTHARSHSDDGRSAKKRRKRRHSVDSVHAGSSRSASEPLSSPRPGRRRVLEIDSSSDEDAEPRHAPSKKALEGKSLKGKRKRALGAMMPAAFFKRAARDLELMQEEKLTYDNGSGDDSEAGSEAFDSDGELRPGKTATRKGKQRAIDLTGDAFTDESTEREGSGDEEEEAPVADAVTNWLGAFGPKRKTAAKTKDKSRDFLDRLLVQSKKDSRRLAPPAKKKGKERQSRLPFAERSNADDLPRPVDAHRRAQKQTIRFDEQSLFESRGPAIGPIDLTNGDTTRATEGWDTFGRFSHDFGLQRLPVGLAFAPDSYLGKGHLQTLAAALRGEGVGDTLQAPLDVFGIHLDADLSDADIITRVPQLCDRIFAELETQTLDDASTSFVGDICGALQWLAVLLSRKEDATLRSEVDVQLSHLQQRLAALQLKAHESLQLRWAFIEYGLRCRQPAAAVQALVAGLVEQLMAQSLAKMVARLKERSTEESLDPQKDEAMHSVQIWICLLRLSIDTGQRTEGLNVTELWRCVEAESDKRASQSKLVPVQGSEALAFVAAALSMLSQFSLDGKTTADPTLPAQWSIVLTPLQRINPAAFADDTSKLSNTGLQRRDAYVATLLARCLIFVDRWAWVMDGREGLLPRLFDVINSRLLARLATDGPRDFPGFLQEFDGQVGTVLDRRGDTAFHVFLKLFVHLSKHLAGDTEAERKKAFSKLVTRLVPQRKMPFTRDAVSSRVSLDRSVLVNHYSLFMVLILVSPQSASLRLGQVRNLLSFEEADDEARLICLRAIMYMGILLRHLRLDLGPILAWLAHICRFLRGQYEALENRRQPVAKTGGARQADPTAKDMYSVALSLSTVLRAIQHLLSIDAKIANASTQRLPYPSMALLDDGWMKELVHSPLAQDPLIGSELLQVLECFLCLREDALSQRETSISQDEFGGMTNLDYEDPALCAMLGIEPSKEAAQIQEDESKFAKLVHADLSSALFRLITAAYARDTSKTRAAPVVSARSNVRYVEELVGCWSKCAAIAVKAGLRDWQQYIVWGDEVWKRISDPLGRRDVALRFFVQAIESDVRAFQLNKDEYMSVWCQTIMAKRLTLQHRLTSAILDADREPSLLGDDGPFSVPFARDDESGRYSISLEELTERRSALLDVVLQRAHRLLLNGGSNASSYIVAHIAGMCTAARDNLESFDALEAAAKTNYIVFARHFADQLKALLSPAVTDTMAALKLLTSSLDKAEASNV